MKKKLIAILLLLVTIMPAMSVQAITKVSCGNIDGIPEKIPQLTSLIITIIQVAVPIALVIIGSIDLIKGVIAQKEDEIKKGQKVFVKRLIVAILIFLIIVIVKLIISVAADSDDINNITECMDCFLSGADNCSKAGG